MTEEKPSGKASTRAKNKYNAKAYDQKKSSTPQQRNKVIAAETNLS